jgi:hypothetical protein
MLTRIPTPLRETMKSLAADPEYGSLRNMCDVLFFQFLKEKSYKNTDFAWKKPASKGTAGWIAYNVVLNDELSARVKFESAKLDVSLTTLLYTAIELWVESKKNQSAIKSIKAA